MKNPDNCSFYVTYSMQLQRRVKLRRGIQPRSFRFCYRWSWTELQPEGLKTDSQYFIQRKVTLDTRSHQGKLCQVRVLQYLSVRNLTSCEKCLRLCVVCVLTEASVAGELLVDLLHSLNVEATCLCMVHHGLGVMHPNYTFGCFLHVLWSVPGIINILGWKPPQNWQVAPEQRDRGLVSMLCCYLLLQAKNVPRSD